MLDLVTIADNYGHRRRHGNEPGADILTVISNHAAFSPGAFCAGRAAQRVLDYLLAALIGVCNRGRMPRSSLGPALVGASVVSALPIVNTIPRAIVPG